MPTAKSAAAADAKRKTTKPKDKDKKFPKDKPKRKSGDDKPKRRSAEDTPPPVQPPSVDPDAVQLFRRYDRARSGAMLRSDFLQLLRDYAGGRAARSRSRPPLSLTDSRGVPLGYERAEKNSEFEAGQLFERYDKAHVGALSLDAFSEFFRDFQTQLRGFVDDLSYSTSEHARGEPVATSPPAQDDASTASPPQAPSVRAEYQATLWELRKICKDELTQQRERIRDEMARLRSRLASRAPRRHPEDEHDEDERWQAAFSNDHHRRYDMKAASRTDNQLLDRYDAMESDLERVDDVLRTTRRQLRRGLEASADEMEAFLRSAPELLADARELAMKVYVMNVPSPRREKQETRSESPQTNNGQYDNPRGERQKESLARAPSPADKRVVENQADHRDVGDQTTVEQLQKTLRIKDQLIYQLLQERTTLRRQKAAAEADLQDLSQVSTDEMRKWAQLTDEMQQEIALLRNRLSRIDDRRRDLDYHHDDNDDGYAYAHR